MSRLLARTARRSGRAVARATIRWSGMPNSRTSTGGMAPPHGLMRPARSSSSTERPCARQVGRRGGAGRPAAHHHDVEVSRLRASARSLSLATARAGRARRRAALRTRATASRAATRNSTASAANTRGIGERRVSRAAAAPGRWRRSPTRPPTPKASACAAPHMPIRVPSRAAAAVAGQAHHRADGRRPRTRRWRRRAPTPPARSGARPGRARQRPAPARPAAEATQPPIVQARIARPRTSPASRPSPTATSTMPASTPPCAARSARRSGRASAGTPRRRTARASVPGAL